MKKPKLQKDSSTKEMIEEIPIKEKTKKPPTKVQYASSDEEEEDEEAKAKAKRRLKREKKE